MHSVRVQEKDFSVHDEWKACRERLRGKAGAVVSFIGLVRERSTTGKVSSLYLEHYPRMTEASIDRIVAKAQQRWSLLDVIVIHRIGELQPEDQIVLVIVASAHRADAFAACEFIMDLLKTEAVFWKKETGDEESVWIESTLEDVNRSQEWQE
ncbi:MAG: molybdenum cofactor biosynthesis protein MoaE [Gammaproteobacteria bacterium]|nr:molybdenum cofactor biosynthesis protein MoaE [Gammaproteobacteria bacterium]MYI76913.1 molybdenum cofactor biosynthesis protein MoaE [Gammaproteobacteria bacterium]